MAESLVAPVQGVRDVVGVFCHRHLGGSRGGRGRERGEPGEELVELRVDAGGVRFGERVLGEGLDRRRFGRRSELPLGYQVHLVVERGGVLGDGLHQDSLAHPAGDGGSERADVDHLLGVAGGGGVGEVVRGSVEFVLIGFEA